ncbi:MAG: hypothetical protein ACRD1M_11340 [Terriglobales bacterium]
MLKLQYFTALLLPLAVLAPAPGAARAQAPAVGYFHLAQSSGVTALYQPAGARLRLRALDHVRLISASAARTDLAPAYVDERSAALLAAMEQDGFNALGGDTDAELWHRGLPFIQQLDLSRHLAAGQQNPVVDVYEDGFAAAVYALVQSACIPQRQDPELIGYLSDPGLEWDPGAHPEVVFRFYLSQSMTAPARLHALDFLRLRYAGGIAQLNRAWGIHARDFLTLAPPPAAQANAAFRADAGAFAVQVLARYLATVAGAIHAADPNHLYLGAELAVSPAPDASLRSAWSIPDVASMALAADAAGETAADAAALAPRPVLLDVRGCASPPVSLLREASVIGYIWTPDHDWQSGACGEAARAWRQFNGPALRGQR